MILTNPLMAYAEIPPFCNPDMTDYGDAKTTYWGDFRVCGKDERAIRDTYSRAKKFALEDKEYGTELAMVLNWLTWLYHDNGEEQTARVYDELWKDLDKTIMETWKGEDLQYYIRTTDQ